MTGLLITWRYYTGFPNVLSQEYGGIPLSGPKGVPAEWAVAYYFGEQERPDNAPPLSGMLLTSWNPYSIPIRPELARTVLFRH
tara:strand:+ start:122 stop:370 length:249 start_codon:yes stop_codon:yes gene_type:complete